jgi:hypothetical protein
MDWYFDSMTNAVRDKSSGGTVAYLHSNERTPETQNEGRVLAAAPAVLAALKCAQALDARNGAFVLVSHGWNRDEETATAFVARLTQSAIDSAEGR